MRKVIVVFIIMTIFSLGVYLWRKPDEYLHIIQCDVGQGDALLVSYGSQQMLIDQGPNEIVLHCLENHLPFWDRTIEVVIVTHADQDHVGGLPSILENYTVSHLFFNPTDKSTQTVEKLESIISHHQIEREELYLGDKITLKNKKRDVVFHVVSPERELMTACGFQYQKHEQKDNPNKRACPKEYAEENNRSTSGELIFNKVSLLSMGDAQSMIEEAVMPHLPTRDIDMLKISHHGSKFSTSDDFIKSTTPETALLSVGENNRFGHPTTRVIDTLRSNNIHILRTDELGDIELVSDGERYWLKNTNRCWLFCR